MAASEEFDVRPVRAFLPGPGLQVDESVWPASVPAMALLELGSWALRSATRDDLSLVVAWRQFMRDPAVVLPAPVLKVPVQPAAAQV